MIRIRDLWRRIIAKAREAARLAAERARAVNLVTIDDAMFHYYTRVDPDPLRINNMFMQDAEGIWRRRPNRRNR